MNDKIAELLWAVLIRQARIDAYVHSALILGLLAAGFALLSAGRSRWRSARNSDQKEVAAGVLGASALAFAIAAMSALIFGGNIVAGFVNPEYVALSKILSFR